MLKAPAIVTIQSRPWMDDYILFDLVEL